MAAAEIQVKGLKELRKSLKGFETDTSWRPALRAVYDAVARDVESAAVAKAGSSRMGSAARATIKGKGTTTNAKISAGGGLPYYAGFEFGSGRFHQFPPKLTGGYNLYPSIEEKRDQIRTDFVDQIGHALDSEGLT